MADVVSALLEAGQGRTPSNTAVVRVVSRGGSMWGYNGYGYAATAAQGAVTRLPAVTSARAVVVAVLLGASPD
jgi:hypothetical protein